MQTDRKIDAASLAVADAAGLSGPAARVLAGRVTNGSVASAIIAPRLQDIPRPDLFADIDRAADRIASAVMTGERIGICVDYDVDGISGGALACAIMREAFGVDPGLVTVHVSHRMEDGYGFTEGAASRVASCAGGAPSLIITVDQGSRDGAGIARYLDLARAQGVEADVIVTDHHHIDGTGPECAYAVVNPQRPDCRYPDKTVCGAMVAFLVMVAVKGRLMAAGRAVPGLARYLAFAAAATIADCVDLSSPANRAVVQHGLGRINAGDRPAWRALKRLVGEGPVRAESLAFTLGPRINSASRTGGDGQVALGFLLAPTDAEADDGLALIGASNQDRKDIERAMTEGAMREAQAQVEAGAWGLVIHLADGHMGVQGIVASRIQEAYGRPVVVLTPKNDQEITGSARSVPGVDILGVLTDVQSQSGVFTRFGGHAAAAGMTLARDAAAVRRLQSDFDAAVRAHVSADRIGPRRVTDGALAGHDITMRLIDDLQRLEPFGAGFEAPLFTLKAQVISARRMGDGTHLKIGLAAGARCFDAVWFRFTRNPDDPVPVTEGDVCTFLVEPKDNHFRGERRLQLMVSGIA